MSNPFVQGEAATERVESDPFWSVVRRRHPDVDIVLLPRETGPAGPGSVAAEVPLADADDEAAVQQAEAARLWELCVGDGVTPAASSRWTHGSTEGASRHETTWRLDDVDEVAAMTTIQRGARVLADEGWHVLAPADGMPRVLAGRGVGPERVELQLVHAPAQSRLVLRLRSAEVRLTDPSAGQEEQS